MIHLRLPAVLLLAVILVAGCGFVISGAPQLVSPPNGSTQPCFTDPAGGWIFVWTAVPNAVQYIFQLVVDATGVVAFQAVLTGEPPATSITVPGSSALCGETYRWRVGATFANRAAPAWSGYWTVIFEP